jgi:hypothetical protein
MEGSVLLGFSSGIIQTMQDNTDMALPAIISISPLSTPAATKNESGDDKSHEPNDR